MSFRIVPTYKPSDIYAAGFDGNRFDSAAEAEAAIPGLAATMPAGDPGADPDFWTVTEE